LAPNVTITGIPPPTDPVEPPPDIKASAHAPKLCAKGLAFQNIEKEAADFERNHALDGRDMIDAKKRKADHDAETAKHEESIAKTRKLSQAVQDKIEVLDEEKEKNYGKRKESLEEQQEKAESSLRRVQARTYAELGEQLRGTKYEEGIPDSDGSEVEVFDEGQLFSSSKS